MNKISTGLLLLLCVTCFGVAHGQVDSLLRQGYDNTFLYRRYAPRQDLTVAHLVHLPIDSATFVNAVMLRAVTDEAWGGLLREFAFKPPMQDASGRRYHTKTFTYRDARNPVEKAPMQGGRVDVLNSCIVIMAYDDYAIWIIHYKTIKEAEKILDNHNKIITT